ncbi:MAG: chemotaxis protein CheD [Bryobacteraceae bacterium]|jgi:chemotaxis protein CheD
MMTARPEIRVQPGEVYLVRYPAILQTILGSCVSATFWIERLGAGALCHGLLPRCPPGAKPPDAFRYVDFSIRYLAEQFDALGACRHEVEVKLFGGADVLPSVVPRTGQPTVGALNSRAAWEVLAGAGLTVLASDLGGVRGRSIQFDTASGEVLVRRLAMVNRGGAPASPAVASYGTRL